MDKEPVVSWVYDASCLKQYKTQELNRDINSLTDMLLDCLWKVDKLTVSTSTLIKHLNYMNHLLNYYLKEEEQEYGKEDNKGSRDGSADNGKQLL